MKAYKVGVFVTFCYEYEDTVLGEWTDNQIAAIDNDSVTFEDIDGTFPLDVIEKLAEDQREED